MSGLKYATATLAIFAVLGGSVYFLSRPTVENNSSSVASTSSHSPVAPKPVLADATHADASLQTATLPKEPAVVQLPTVLQKPSDWTQMGVRSDLRKELAAIRDSRSYSGVPLAAQIFSLCFSVVNQLDMTGLIPAYFTSKNDRERIAQNLVSLNESARSLCKDVDINVMEHIGTNKSGKRSLTSFLGKAASRDKQQYSQKITELLLNPSQDALAFDTWLSTDLWGLTEMGRKSEFSLMQRAFVEDQVYVRFFSDAQVDSIRNLQRCRLWLKCVGIYGLSDLETAAAMAFSDTLEGAIRTQRWHLIFG